MKHCPTCNKNYTDETLNFCLDDGAWLAAGTLTNEPTTAIFLEPEAVATGFRVDEEMGEEQTAILSGPPALAGSLTRPLDRLNDSIRQHRPPANAGGSDSLAMRKKWRMIAVAALLLVTGGIGFAVYKFWDKPVKAPQAFKIERLTTNGKARDAAISPDGKYVVYILDEGGQQSLWTRQVATSSNVQITPPADVGYWALSFTPDGNYINFGRIEKNTQAALYQMPVLGGAQKKLLSDVYGAVSYSPDGKQFAFVRGNYPNLGESALLIANADGTGERVIAQRRQPETFPWWRLQPPAWSPDGNTIACIAGSNSTGSGLMNIVEVKVADGTIKPVTSQGWYEIKRVAWLEDQSGLLVIGAVKSSDFFNQQIWHISYPGGEARRITTDLSEYFGLSLTADSNVIAAVQSNRISNIWVAPIVDTASRAVQVKSGGNNQDGTDGLAWTPDGKIIYYSRASGADDIWVMNADGTGQKQLTVDAGTNYDIKVTPDGRYIVLTSERPGQNLWRMDLDGGNPRQLTSGNSDYGAAVSPDSKWVIYNSNISGRPALWKVSIDGGDPVQLTEYAAENPEVSPDGTLIACQYREATNSPWRYAIIPYDGGKPLKIFDLAADNEGDIRWSPDGRLLTYANLRNGVSNIWGFPLDGSPPKQLTDFKADYIYNFKWSPDGKQLVLTRGTTTSDVVLIKDFR